MYRYVIVMEKKTNIVKLYKQSRKIRGYIVKYSDEHYEFHTGKPSDASCFGWKYSKLSDALKTGDEYFENITSFKDVIIK